MRAGDTVYRTGGEEFSVLLPGLEADRAGAVAERLRHSVAGIACPLPVTISVGIASFPRDATGRDELVQKADAALYASKHTGKNRTTLASASAPAAAEARPGALDLRAPARARCRHGRAQRPRGQPRRGDRRAARG